MRSDQAAQGFVQLGLENLQGGRLHNLSGQPTLLSDCSHGGKAFPCLWSETLISLMHSCISFSHPAPLRGTQLLLLNDRL